MDDLADKKLAVALSNCGRDISIGPIGEGGEVCYLNDQDTYALFKSLTLIAMHQLDAQNCKNKQRDAYRIFLETLKEVDK